MQKYQVPQFPKWSPHFSWVRATVALLWNKNAARRRQWQSSKEKEKDKSTSTKAFRMLPPALPVLMCFTFILHWCFLHYLLGNCSRQFFQGVWSSRNWLGQRQGRAGTQTEKLQLLRGPGHSHRLLQLSRDTAQQIPAAALYLFCHFCSSGWNHRRKFLKEVFLAKFREQQALFLWAEV